MIIAGYSQKGSESIQKWVKKSDVSEYEKVWASDIEAPSYIDYDEDYLVALTASKAEGVLHFFVADGLGYKKVDEVVFDTMGLCHVTYLKETGLVLASSYHQGALVVAKVQDHKFVGQPAVIRHEPGEDGLSRIHCAVANGDESLVYVANIAKDQIYVYKVVGQELEEFKIIDVAENSGPRHIIVDDEKSRLYIMTEYLCDVIVIDIKGEDYEIEGYYKTLPEDFDGINDGGAIDMSPDGKFLYVTNRGHDSVTCFNIEDKIEQIQIYTHTGHWPRHMSVISDTLLGVAGRRGNVAELIERDPVTGKLKKRVQTFDFVEPSYIH